MLLGTYTCDEKLPTTVTKRPFFGSGGWPETPQEEQSKAPWWDLVQMQKPLSEKVPSLLLPFLTSSITLRVSFLYPHYNKACLLPPLLRLIMFIILHTFYSFCLMLSLLPQGLIMALRPSHYNKLN